MRPTHAGFASYNRPSSRYYSAINQRMHGTRPAAAATNHPAISDTYNIYTSWLARSSPFHHYYRYIHCRANFAPRYTRFRLSALFYRPPYIQLWPARHSEAKLYRSCRNSSVTDGSSFLRHRLHVVSPYIPSPLRQFQSVTLVADRFQRDRSLFAEEQREKGDADVEEAETGVRMNQDIREMKQCKSASVRATF